MKDASFSGILERLFLATKSKTDSALAIALGITAQSVSQAKKKQQIPAQWFIDVANTYGVSVDWLISGLGTMRSGEKEEGELRAQSTMNWVAEHACTRCQKLESELEQERESGRKKDEVLFDFIKRIERYMEENGELRLEVVKQKAQLETARQMCHQYAEFIKSKGLENPLFQNTEVTHFSESLPFHQAPPATSPPEHPPRHKK